jgi:hypothetical protein
MATTPKKEIRDNFKKSNPGPSKRRRDGFLSAVDSLLDTAQTSTPSPSVNTTSGSNVVNIPLIQPANTALEDIIVLCTAATSHDTATIGFRAGTTAYGDQQIITGSDSGTSSIAGSGTSTTVGQGTSIHSKIATSLQGGGPHTIIAGSGYTTEERTIYCQVSGSTGAFDTDTGAFRVIGKYYNL